MNSFLDRLNVAFPFIHTAIFAVGIASNAGLITAALKRTPRMLQSYAIMITIGSINDLVSVCCDFFTQQRMLVVPGNLLYLSLGPCNLISPRVCYLGYCLQLCTLAYSFFIIVASFGYRQVDTYQKFFDFFGLLILHRESPSRRNMFIFMAILFVIPALVGGTFTFAQADDNVVREFLMENAPDYLLEKGALTGHSGFTPHLIFTILFMIGAPWPLYIAILGIRNRILTTLRKFSSEMSERTRSMHRDLVRALTIHAMLPPIYFIGVGFYLVLYFDLYRHSALEKAIYTVNALPTALAAFCTICYVEPYRRYLSFKATILTTPLTTPKTSVVSMAASMTSLAPNTIVPRRKYSQSEVGLQIT